MISTTTNSQLSSNRLPRLEKNYIPFSFCLKVLMFLMFVLLFLNVQGHNKVTLNASAVSCDGLGLRTQSQGGWGAVPNGTNSGFYLHQHFAAAFPSGITIGCGSNTLTLTSAQAVTAFLPSGGTAVPLPAGTMIDPSNYSNGFAGQTFALSLSVGFDYYDPSFGASAFPLGDMVINAGTFAGWSVNAVLSEANKVLGGCSSTYTSVQLSSILASITLSLDNGTVDLGVVSCPVPPLALTGLPFISCFNGEDGTIDLSISGGIPPYSYTWSNGATSEDPDGLSPGTYSVVVTDFIGSFVTLSVDVVAPPELVVSITGSDALCNGSSEGAADASVSGGTPPYSYSWSNGASTEDISGLSAGTYELLVTCANGCSASASVTIAEPSALELSIAGTDALCNGSFDGSADASISGGTPPYSYSWANGESSEDLNGLAAGSYSLEVKDANGCIISASVIIGEPSALELSIAGSDALCNGSSDGSADAFVSGGTPPYSYSWSNGESLEDLSGLAAGSYSLEVKDANGCMISASVLIGEPSALELSIAGSDALCNGSSDGSADASVNGGTPPYSYSWSNGESSEDLNGLAAGSYSLEVKDANGCIISAGVIIGEPSALELSIAGSDALCNGGSDGSADASVSGGTPPYSYSWSNGESSEDLNGVTAGSYNLEVTDANGCMISAGVIIGEPSALELSIAGIDALCNGSSDGSADASVSGGTPPYSYSWSNGESSEDLGGLAAGSYNLELKDANGCMISASVTIAEPSALELSIAGIDALCNGSSDGSADASVNGGTPPYSYSWSNGESLEDLSGLAAGSYSLEVTDGNGCVISSSVVISEPDALSLEIAGSDALCNGSSDGSADASVSGGTPPYSYSWSNGESSEDLGGLVAGTYSLEVKDANGCMISASVTIAEPALLSPVEAHVNVAVFGGSDGSADVSVSGGIPPYSYSWSNGASTAGISNLIAGIYTLTVTDAHECTASLTIEITEPPCNAGFRTQTQGGWGAQPNGYNQGTYLYNNFSSVFPTGLTIGAGTRKILLTAAKSVTNFLPSGSTARALSAGTMTNPTRKSYNNVLAGQVVALTLNVAFDAANPDFGSAPQQLGNLVVVSGTFAGWSVNEILAEANNILGGLASLYSAAQMNLIASAINENYDNGTANKGLLVCPSERIAQSETGGNMLLKQTHIKLNAYPNPFYSSSTIEFLLAKDDDVKLEVYDLKGSQIATLYTGKAQGNAPIYVEFNVGNLVPGMYICMLRTSNGTYYHRLMFVNQQ